MYNLQLETFLRVADAGSFNKAAAESFITPTAVIKQINLLEEKLGVPLFERTHRGLILTEAGKSMYQDAKYIIQYCKDSVDRAKNAVKTEDELLRIGTSPMTPASVLLELWPKIHERCPEMKFRLIPFDNTPENAREILGNLGQNIDVVAGIFDDTMLDLRRCAGVQIRMEPICVAVSIHHPLAGKERLAPEDLYGQNLLLIHRNWSRYVDGLRDEIEKNHRQIHIQDFDFYSMEVFNRCENSNDVLMAVGAWENVHPLLKILPVEWEYRIPYGLLHSPKPSGTVKKFLAAAPAVNKPLVPDSRPEAIRASVEHSLARLGTDHIDLYYQHRQDPAVPVEEVAGVMSELMAEGKITHWGLSEADEETIRRAHRICPVTAIQNRYSMMARWYEPLFPVLEELHIGFVAFSPLANGFLSARYDKGSVFEAGTDYRSIMPQFTPEGMEKNQGLLALLHRIAQEKQATSAQISLAWMLAKRPYIVPIPGTRKEGRLLENAGAAGIALAPEEIASIDGALNHMEMSEVFGGTRMAAQGR